MNGRGDPDGTEYAGGPELRGLEGLMSLARFLGTTVGHVLDLRDKNQLGPAIQKRNAERAAEQRAAGYVSCGVCGGQVQRGAMCGCGERAPGRAPTLDGRAARWQLLERMSSW